MQQKYYYQKGMCDALHYQSLNPVLYFSLAEGMNYSKQKMACSAIETGKCTNSEKCRLFKDAPDNVKYNDHLLCAEKLR